MTALLFALAIAIFLTWVFFKITDKQYETPFSVQQEAAAAALPDVSVQLNTEILYPAELTEIPSREAFGRPNPPRRKRRFSEPPRYAGPDGEKGDIAEDLIDERFYYWVFHTDPNWESAISVNPYLYSFSAVETANKGKSVLYASDALLDQPLYPKDINPQD